MGGGFNAPAQDTERYWGNAVAYFKLVDTAIALNLKFESYTKAGCLIVDYIRLLGLS